ncbi:MAG: hypothetical protein FWG10_09165 [Eubacteriaceae bacterium]|nr:hypothetical protein [Eubacteriaceae bacterium]
MKIVLGMLLLADLFLVVVLIAETLTRAIESAKGRKIAIKKRKKKSCRKVEFSQAKQQPCPVDNFQVIEPSQKGFQKLNRYHQQEEHSLLEEPKIVINSKSEYKPIELKKPYKFPGKTPNPQNDERRYLILGEYTEKKIKDSVDWGMRTKRNIVEQGGVLLGNIAYYSNEIYCFVEDILLADTAGNPMFVEFTIGMWASMQNELADINSHLSNGKQLVIVGWFHTHPNRLSVFMSGTDMSTQRLNFSLDWQSSLVMNPHTSKYRAFFGAGATEGKVVMLSTANVYEEAIIDGIQNID